MPGTEASILIKSLVLGCLSTLLVSCSWTHYVWLENATTAPATVSYRLSCHTSWCFFPDSAVVFVGESREVHRMDPADSTITFTLPAGARAQLAQGFNTTYRNVHENSSMNSRVDNLVWLRIGTASGEREYSATEFVAASDTRKAGGTLFRVKD